MIRKTSDSGKRRRLRGTEHLTHVTAVAPAAAESPPPPPAEAVPPPPPTSVHELVASLSVSRELATTISQLPQHLETGEANPQWLFHRKFRLTGSRFGAAVGLNPYSDPENLCKDMLWSVFKGNKMTEYGNQHEDDALGAYVHHRRLQCLARGLDPAAFRVEERGLCLSEDPATPFLAMSPDGIIYEPDGTVGLLEIKCPWKLRQRPVGVNAPFYKRAAAPGHPDRSVPIPSYYWCQIQGGMYIFRSRGMPMNFADFVVWTREETQITRVPYAEEWVRTFLVPGLTNFYHRIYAPAMLLKLQGKLQPGELRPSIEVDLTDRPAPQFPDDKDGDGEKDMSVSAQ